MAFASLDEAIDWLESHVDYERVAPNRQTPPSLDQVRNALAALGSPETDYPSIHITGTNGKGTTTTLTSALLAETGLRVGTYTSPDLHAINERIGVAGEPVDDDSLRVLFSRLADLESVTGIEHTRFELLTVAAFLHFSDEGVDVGVIEVGLGGTWDSTNVIDADVSVLTNVDLDHTAVLGDTVEAIASDKVGIFRSSGVAVVGTTHPGVLEIARTRTGSLGCELFVPGDQFELERNDVAVGGRLLTFRTPFAHYEDVLLSLHGVHQGDNAVVAVTASELFLGRAIGDEPLRAALSRARMPGRLEVLQHRPMIVVDGAHNPAGTRALANALDGAFFVDGTRRCVIGMLTGRDPVDMVTPLVQAGVNEFLVCAPKSPRALDANALADVIRSLGATASVHPDGASALAHARERSGDDDLIIAAGSLYLVAEVRGVIYGIEDRHR